jgi:RNA polymerase sigma factor for flagellar operon FliA
MRIRGAMIDELRSQDLLSRDARERANRVSEVWQGLLQELGRKPRSHEIADVLGFSTRDVDDVLRKTASQNVVSLDISSLEGGVVDDGLMVSEDLIDAHLEPPDAAHQKDLLGLIDQSLTAAERAIVDLRYRDGMTLRRIGRVLGISESRVCQVHGRLLGRLHRRLSAEA